ncbi:FG-GAP and VCBS repeat-containing protein [Streptomyces rhizosphaerihabitans]|uniref:FG-GAP and VCBS repeat-containing protein n=1 Tax=Streptomyces rhizosphaerihabitans TaxID=1266770 RepID=UPI0021BFB544|nr:FG-GAP and VCBS repeat-containing protein [Streptomyces rhizosphaerihabitans]MCT9008226.1 FG-GAP and VCBS repeat-containing protein [Streptomyces rhizosphaerihabitans]
MLATVTAVSVGTVVLGAGSPAGAAPGSKASAAGKSADFNGDGYGDLGISANGHAVVMYGAKTGLSGSRHQVLSDGSGSADPYSEFGDLMTGGDLDGDGYDDLVVGDTGPVPATSIFWGSPKGLSGRTPLSFSLRSMIVGDFDGDGKNDLVAKVDLGYGRAETRLFRGPFGRDGANASTSVVNTGISSGSLSAGDVNSDHIPDLLAVGRHGNTADASLILGSKNGFGPPKDFSTMVNSGSLADVDGDGYADVVLGAGLEGYQPKGVVGGSVVVHYGSAGGVSTTRKPVRISQDTAGVPGTGEKYDRFGFHLDTGDVDGDGYADVAIGVMQESISGVSTTGAVTVLRGSSKGLTATGAVSWHQNTAGVPGVNEPYDMFGWQVSLIDMNGDGRSELATSTDSENRDEGNLWYFRSGSKGLTTNQVVSIGPKTVGLTAKYRYFARWLAN